jgi:hypothetical protein
MRLPKEVSSVLANLWLIAGLVLLMTAQLAGLPHSVEVGEVIAWTSRVLFGSPAEGNPSYPPAAALRGSAPPARAPNREAVARLCAVELFAGDFSRALAGPCRRPGPPPLRAGELPAPTRLNGPDGPSSRMGTHVLWTRTPWMGFLTHYHHHGPARAGPVLVAPVPGEIESNAGVVSARRRFFHVLPSEIRTDDVRETVAVREDGACGGGRESSSLATRAAPETATTNSGGPGVAGPRSGARRVGRVPQTPWGGSGA